GEQAAQDDQPESCHWSKPRFDGTRQANAPARPTPRPEPEMVESGRKWRGYSQKRNTSATGGNSHFDQGHGQPDNLQGSPGESALRWSKCPSVPSIRASTFAGGFVVAAVRARVLRCGDPHADGWEVLMLLRKCLV